MAWLLGGLWLAMFAPERADGIEIHAAVQEGDAVKVWKLLLARREAVHDLAAGDQSTALHDAVRHDRIVIARLLIVFGANVNAKTKYGYTPLKLAKGYGRTDLVALLEANGGLLLEPPPKARVQAVAPPQPQAHRAVMPRYATRLHGDKTLRIVNGSKTPVSVRVLAGNAGADLLVTPGSSRSVSVPEGVCELYYIFSSEPSVLYQGDDVYIAWDTASLTIQLNTSHGNYRLRRLN